MCIITLVTNPMSQQRPLSVKDTGYVASAFCSVALFTYLHTIFFILKAYRVRLSVLFVCPINICLTDCTLLAEFYVEITFVTVLTQSLVILYSYITRSIYIAS